MQELHQGLVDWALPKFLQVHQKENQHNQVNYKAIIPIFKTIIAHDV